MQAMLFQESETERAVFGNFSVVRHLSDICSIGRGGRVVTANLISFQVKGNVR